MTELVQAFDRAPVLINIYFELIDEMAALSSHFCSEKPQIRT